jgi:hypothetical protein
MLKRAVAFCREIFLDSQATTLENAVRSTFQITMRDHPHQRSNINEVMRVLAEGAR